MAILKVELSPPFLGWIFQFGNKVKIVSPENVRDMFVKHITGVKQSYKGEEVCQTDILQNHDSN